MKSRIRAFRASTAYRFVAGTAATGLFVASAAMWMGSQSGEGRSGPQVADAREPGTASQRLTSAAEGTYVIPAPRSVDDLIGMSPVVVRGQLAEEVGRQTVILATSSPLGEAQVRHEVGIELATYKLKVEKYLSGSGPGEILFYQEAALAETQKWVQGTEGIFFLTPTTSWNLDGFAGGYGGYSILAERIPGGVVYGGDRTRPSFLQPSARLTDVESLIQASLKR